MYKVMVKIEQEFKSDIEPPEVWQERYRYFKDPSIALGLFGMLSNFLSLFGGLLEDKK